MAFAQIASIAGAIVTVALVTVFVTSPNTANIIKSIGGAFASSLKAAMGK